MAGGSLANGNQPPLADSNALPITAPHVHVIQTRSFAVQLAAVFVLADEGLEGGAKRVLAVHQA
jgi:hypothetical protein